MSKRFSCLIFFLFVFINLSLPGEVVVAGKLHHEQTARAGENYTGTIVLKNFEDKPQDVKLYQKDYLFFEDGRTIFGDPGNDPRSNAKWIQISSTRTIIPAGGIVTVNFRVDVPPEQSLTGTYWSVLMIESVPEDSPESSSADPNQVTLGLLQKIRYAYQILTNIGDTGTRMLRFTGANLSREEGQVILALDVESTGQRTMKAVLSCELYDNQGNFQDKFDGGSHRLHPGTSRRYKVDLTGIPKGKYKALVIVDCGDDYVFGKNINLVL